MTTTKQFDLELKGTKVTLKPFEFKVTELALEEYIEDSFRVRLTASVLDVQTGKTLEVGSDITMSKVPSVEVLIRTIEISLRKAVEHEIHECLQVDGIPWVNPHP